MSPDTAPTRRNHPVSASPLAFRQTRLGVVGWTALLAPGALAGAGVGLVAGRGRAHIGRLAASVAGGAACGVLIARGIDEVRWRRSAVSLSVDEPDAALDLMQAVRAEGVRADMVRADNPNSAPGHSRGAYALRYRAKEDRRVRAVFAEQQG